MRISHLIYSVFFISFLAYGQDYKNDCNAKNKNALEVSSGNMTSLSKTISVVFIDKTSIPLRYLIQVAGNNEVLDDSHPITQKEIQETVRYIYNGKLTYDDLVKMRTDLLNQKEFQKLSALQQADAQTVLNDIIYVESRMNEYRNISNMYCRFALADNPFDEYPRNSIFRSGVEVENGEGRLTILKMKQDRSVGGLCWYKKKSHNY